MVLSILNAKNGQTIINIVKMLTFLKNVVLKLIEYYLQTFTCK